MKAVALKIQSWFLALTGPLGGWALLLIALADSSFLSLPEVNDILIVTLSIQSPQRMLYYCSMTTIGSILGCLLLYLVGRKGGEVLTRKKFAPRQLEKIGGWYRRFGILAVIIPSILPPPTPFKIFCPERQRLQGQLRQIPPRHHSWSRVSLFSGGIPGRQIRAAGSLLHETSLSHGSLGAPGLAGLGVPHLSVVSKDASRPTTCQSALKPTGAPGVTRRTGLPVQPDDHESCRSH